MRALLIFVILVGLIAASLYGAAVWEERNFAAPGPLSADRVVVIEQGESSRGIAETLKGAGVIANDVLFRIGIMRRRQEAALKAGEYAFPAHVSMRDAMALLVSGKVVEHRITIAEGLTSQAAIDIVRGDPVLVGEAKDMPPEGSLLPETYNFRRGTTRPEMVARMRKAQETLLAELWPKRKAGLPYGSPADAVKLASIVEKETALPSERPRIAAIFINRLKSGMKLESDPTIIYGLTQGVPLGHPLRQSEIAKPNPYSTYQNPGLPPTPICNPGRDAIAAVLNPPDSEELFFVADGHGGHAFAKTGAEHARNVAKLREIERAQAK